VESKSLGNGLLLARALLASGGRSANVRVLNGSKEGKTVAAGQIFGVTKPAIRIEVPPASQKPDSNDNQHIQCLMENLPDSLTAEQKDRAAQFLQKHASVF